MDDELESVLDKIKEYVENDSQIDATKKAITIQVYDADPEDVERLIRNEDYRLACVCGTIKGTVRLIAVKETEGYGFKISNAVFSKVVLEEEYYKLKES